jgi:hypothetical protein
MGYTKHFGICGAWYSGGYLYVVMDDITGTGRGIYRFAVTDGDPPTATYDSYVAWNTLGLAGTYGWWYQRGTSLYDPTDDAVFLATYGTGAAQTPCAGKWSMSNWPFASGNADWKALTQKWGGVAANNIIGYGFPYLIRGNGANGHLYIPSWYSGKVTTVDWANGSVLGDWVYYNAWSANYGFQIVGQDASGNPIGGSVHASGGAGDAAVWDISNLSSWSKGAVKLPAYTSYGQGYGLQYAHAKNNLASNLVRYYPLQENERSALVCETIAAWTALTYNDASGLALIFADPTTGDYREASQQKHSSYQRAGYGPLNQHTGKEFLIMHNDIPWFFAPSDGTIDLYNEDARGPQYTKGFAITHAGIGRADLTWTATNDQTPKILVHGVEKAATNSEFSDHPGKFRFALDINGGGYTSFRSGVAELSHLDEVVNGKGAWSAWSNGDTVTLRMEMHSGLIHNFSDVQGNPGALATPNLPIADFGPPRDVRPVLLVDESFPGAGKHVAAITPGISVTDFKPTMVGVVHTP